MPDTIAAFVLVASLAVAAVAAICAWVGLIGLTHLLITLAGAVCAGYLAARKIDQ